MRLFEVVRLDVERTELVGTPAVLPHGTAANAATSTWSAAVDGELEKAATHLPEELGVACRQEAIRALAAHFVLDPLALERLGDLAGGLLGREDERDATPEDTLQDRADERVVRAAEDDGVHVGVLERGCVLADGGGDLLAEDVVALDERNQTRTGDRYDLHSCVERVDELRIPSAGDGRVRGQQPDPAVPRREHRSVRLGGEHADDGKGELPLEVGKSRGRRGVARGDDELDALLLEVARDLGGEAADLVERARPVGKPRAVSEVHEVLVRERDEALVQDGEAAHARVEDADGAGIHARGV